MGVRSACRRGAGARLQGAPAGAQRACSACRAEHAAPGQRQAGRRGAPRTHPAAGAPVVGAVHQGGGGLALQPKLGDSRVLRPAGFQRQPRRRAGRDARRRDARPRALQLQRQPEQAREVGAGQRERGPQLPQRRLLPLPPAAAAQQVQQPRPLLAQRQRHAVRQRPRCARLSPARHQQRDRLRRAGEQLLELCSCQGGGRLLPHRQRRPGHLAVWLRCVRQHHQRRQRHAARQRLAQRCAQPPGRRRALHQLQLQLAGRLAHVQHLERLHYGAVLVVVDRGVGLRSVADAPQQVGCGSAGQRRDVASCRRRRPRLVRGRARGRCGGSPRQRGPQAEQPTCVHADARDQLGLHPQLHLLGQLHAVQAAGPDEPVQGVSGGARGRAVCVAQERPEPVALQDVWGPRQVHRQEPGEAALVASCESELRWRRGQQDGWAGVGTRGGHWWGHRVVGTRGGAPVLGTGGQLNQPRRWRRAAPGTSRCRSPR